MKLVISIITVCILAAALMMIPMWIEAQPGGGHGGGGEGGKPPQGPPQEAIEACENKSENDTCEFTSPRGDAISGTCQTIEDLLACVPEDGPHGGRPPQD